MSDLDDLLNDINSSSTKKGGKKKGGAAAKKMEPIKEEVEISTEVPIINDTNKVDNDDLLNELESIPTKKGKKKGGANRNVKEPIEIQEEKAVDNATNDDLLNELSSMPSKKKGKAKQTTKDEKQPEPPKVEINEPPKQEQPVEEGNEQEDEETEDKGDKGEEKKKKKKVVKKVVKKVTKEDKFLKLLQEQAKKKKELEERLQREAEEEERRIREEEELQRKIEEEKKKEEDLEKLKEMERLESLRSRGIKAADLKRLDQKKQQTEEELKKQGFTGGIDEFLKSIPNKIPMKKKPVKKHQLQQTEQKKEEEYLGEEVDHVQEEKEVNEKPNEELLKHVEKDINIQINNDNEDLDWEDFDENKVIEPKPKKVAPQKENAVVEQIKTDVEKEVIVENKKQRAKPKEKKLEAEEEPEYIPKSKLRSPIICILGHVDTGKTKILDKLRKTNVQEGEAGGITQQIGATFFPIENFAHHTTKIHEKFRIEPKIPGFLVIDTPGHESFQNLRVRGSSLCDLAVLVVDIMHGLEKQTIDSIELLRRRKTPFIIALNKLDRIYQWKSTEWGGFRDSYEVQKKNQTREFNDRLNKILMQLVHNNLNVALYDENPSMKEYVNIVPTSAVTGEGMPDLIGMFVYVSQKFLMKKIEFKEEIQCTILEVKVLEGTGTTIDVILVNGTLKVGDKIIIGGLFGPIKTTIKILITPHPMKEMRIKSEYQHHESISGAIGVKIFATDLENALAGSPLYVYKNDDEAEKYTKEITQDFNSIIQDYISKTGKGIMVQASTLGSLEAILTYLHDKKIEIAAVGLGNLQKKDIIKLKTIHSKEPNPLKEYLTVLAFDIKISKDVEQFAQDNDIKIFSADIIYHLFDSYVQYAQQCKDERKKQKEREAVFPCIMKIIPNAVFNRKDPIIIGVDITDGILKIGTPLYVLDKKLPLGVVEGIESNKKPINNVRPKDGSVAIRIKPADTSITVGRQFEETDVIVSHVNYHILIYLI